MVIRPVNSLDRSTVEASSCEEPRTPAPPVPAAVIAHGSDGVPPSLQPWANTGTAAATTPRRKPPISPASR